MNLVSPESVGFSSERLERVNDRLQGYVDSGKLSGALTMLARHGEVFHFQPYGVMDLVSGAPIERDTIFRIFSMTKPVTSVAAMMLYEEGRFSLEDPVEAFIPELSDLKVYGGMGDRGMTLVDQQRPITIRHLLTHTSGFSYGLYQDTPIDKMYRDEDLNNADSNLREFVEKISRIPLLHQPGDKWRYSNAATILGRLIETVSGQQFDQFLRDRLFSPLDMTDTSFFVPESKSGRLATLYSPSRNGRIAPVENSLATRFARPHTFLSGGAGLVSTASDYMRFCQMLIDGGVLDGRRVLSPKTVEMIRSDHLTGDLKPYAVGQDMASYTRGSGFGLGFSVVTDIARHGILGSNGMYYWFGAASCYFWIDPAEELIAILMSQFLPSTYYPLQREFQVDTYQALIDQTA